MARIKGDSPTPFNIAAVVMKDVSWLCWALIERIEPIIRIVASAARYIHSRCLQPLRKER